MEENLGTSKHMGVKQEVAEDEDAKAGQLQDRDPGKGARTSPGLGIVRLFFFFFK